MSQLFLLLFCSLSYAQQGSNAPLEIATQDNTTDTWPYKVKYPNKAVVDNGDGTVSVFGGSGGTVNLTANVGINSASPGQTLDVLGTIRAISFIGDGSQLTGISSPWSRTAPNIYPTTITDNVGIGSISPGTTLDVQGTSRFTSAVNSTQALGVLTSAGSPVLTVDTTNNRVGIGTSSPWSALTNTTTPASFMSLNLARSSFLWEVNANNFYTFGFQNDSVSNSYGALFNTGGANATSYPFVVYAGGTQSIIVTRGDGQTAFDSQPDGTSAVRIQSPTASYMGLKVQGTTSQSADLQQWQNVSATVLDTITSTGNVGIGSTAPGQLLDVNGSVRLAGQFTLNLGSDNKAKIGASAATTPDITFTTNSTEIMRVTNGGNVGIGSATPGQKLDVNGTVRMGGFVMNNGVTNNYVLTTDANGNGTWQASAGGAPGGSSGTIQWNSSSSFAGVSGSGVDANGNVGIGSATPGQKLDVTGTVRVSQSVIVNGSGNNTFGVNVGIGSTSPGQALDVVGTTRLSAGVWAVGIGTSVPQQLCITSGKIGYFNGAWAGSCTAS